MSGDLRTRFRLWRERRRAASVDQNFIGFDKYRRAGAYHWRELEKSPEYRAKVDLIASRVAQGDRVLDIGCGDGAYLSVIGRRCREAVGVDADRDAVRLANEHLSKARVDNVTCMQAPISTISADRLGGRFDLVYSMDVIEHLPDPHELVQAALAASKPGATILVGTPLFLGEALKSPYHVHEFARDEISELLRRSLLVEEEILLTDKRLDGKLHPEAFFVAVCRAS